MSAAPITTHVLRAALGLLGAAQCAAATLVVDVRDQHGRPVADAAVYALPRERTATAPRPASVEQFDKQFIPFVSVVQTGTAVRFPNRDSVRHHVYSFSPARRFELKLYVGDPPEPVVFDKPGEVVLGCNIHDHMLAYVYVVDTPHFAKSGAGGQASVTVPDGGYELHVVHPYQRSALAPQAVRVAGDETRQLAVTLPLDPALAPAAR